MDEEDMALLEMALKMSQEPLPAPEDPKYNKDKWYDNDIHNIKWESKWKVLMTRFIYKYY